MARIVGRNGGRGYRARHARAGRSTAGAEATATAKARSAYLRHPLVTFLLAAMLMFLICGIGMALALRQAATTEAFRDAQTSTELQARDIVAPLLTSAAQVPGPAFDKLDQVVRERVLGHPAIRVQICDESGHLVYSDQNPLIGQPSTITEDELAALRSGQTIVKETDGQSLGEAAPAQLGQLLAVSVGLRTPSGQPLLFRSYQPYSAIENDVRRVWLTTLPSVIVGLLLLYAMKVALAYRMTHKMYDLQEEREELLMETLMAADRERTQIAADLHDGIVQGLVGASYTLSATSSWARSVDQTELADTVDETAIGLRQWVRELRSLIVTVAPPSLHSQGLETCLTDLVSTLESRGLRVHLSILDVGPLPEVVESLVYRVAQEAVRNIVRHAQPSNVQVCLLRVNSWLELRVADDGVGFDSPDRQRRSGSVGLELLSALVATHGGTLQVESDAGIGTMVTLRVPVSVIPQSAELAGRRGAE